MLDLRAKESDFFKNILTLISGTAIAQLIPVLLSPLLRRWIPVEDYAVFEVFFRLISIISIFVALRYPMAVVLPKKEEDAINLVGLSLLINFTINTLLFVAIYLFYDNIAQILNIHSKYIGVLYLVPMGAFLISANTTFNYWLIRKKAFKASSMNKVFHRFSESTLWLLFSWLKLLKALVYGDMIGRTVLFIFSVWKSFLNGFDLNRINFQSIRKVLVLYKDYPLYNTIPSLLNSASLMLPVIFINKFYTYSITSNIGLTIQVLSLPMALISVAVSQVLFQKVTELKNNGDKLGGFIVSLLKKMLILSIIGIVVVQLFSKPLFVFIYGKDYTMAGEFAIIIVFASALKFIVSPLSMVFPALDRIKVSSVWQIIYFILILSLLFFKDLDIKDFLIAYVLIDIFAYSLHALLIYFVVRKQDSLHQSS